ncbi:NAD(P)/FAD-dependent oxidoreductase [Citricoccus sp. NR2]|uniref:NAD(P)/FAD-dependent oxidoreductase n=1 Tax=Citricoccus sp. NR2 TaxID=3004095 RepID=UPI0022DD6A21|nr:FAD-dependent oxidoreductase [Citricoccus sp. NR2]WBL19212.1 FAD-dependent oxidoreductase [Citricoccus sp. NR2]
MTQNSQNTQQNARTTAGVVIVGGGQAGLQAAASLRDGGFTGPVTIVAEEAGQPYQRPPLSKDYLAVSEDGSTPSPLPLRGPAFFAEQDITLLSGTAATAVDREAKTVTLADGTVLPYGSLVFATGARNRELPTPGIELPGIHGLRTLQDAEQLGAALDTARDVVVVGAGFIGLEFAAAALARGARVTVLEFAPRPMGRALTPLLGDWFADAHRQRGLDLRLGEGIASFEAGDDGRVGFAISTTGGRYPADLVVAGVGVQPNDQLAAAAGLETANGIVVDAALRTADPDVYAIGDCANFPSERAGGPFRLESVQNATDHARHVAAVILGEDAPYRALPWFWSTQGPYRLQMANIVRADDETVVVGDPDPANPKFSVFCFRDGVLAAVESVNHPGDHLSARKILAAGIQITREEALAEGFSLQAAFKERS